jgi:hypothetical protein
MVAGGASAREPGCAYSEDAAELSGPFAPPDVVWRRIAPLIWGREAEAPSALPAETTYEWAGSVAEQGLFQAAAAHEFSSNEDAVPGVRPFLRRLLHVADDTSLSRDWTVLLSSQQPVLRELLLRRLGPGPRVGIFAERAWLQVHPGISSRGAVMVEALFGMQVPPPPAGLAPQPEPMDGSTRRQHLEQQVGVAVCAGCHQLFDPLGVSLEHFGADGEYRTLDAGLPVDSSGFYEQNLESGIHFTDNVVLGAQLVDACAVKRGFAGAFLRIALEKAGVPSTAPAASFEQNGQRVEQGFIRGGLTYVALVRAFAQSPAALRR